jgi:hypothetical protein
MEVFRRLRTWLVVLLATPFLAALQPTAPAFARPPAAPAVVFGAGGWSWPTAPTLSDLGHQGLRTWRLTMNWADVSPRPGVMDFSGYDQLMRDAARNNIEMLATLTGCPTWACPAGGPPAGAALDGFAAFTAAAVARYGSAGGAWAGVRARPVRYWQVLNEVNGTDQWPNPDPAGYAAVLSRISATIRAGDPRAKVVVAGLGEKMTIWLRSYLPALYRQPGFRASFDVMAPEGYAVSPRDVPRILTTTRRIMRRYGDAAKPMFVTEMSWSSGGPAFPFTTSESGQAARLRDSWRILRACRARWNLRRVYWFSYADYPPRFGDDYWGFHNGLVETSGREKPAWHAFVQFLRPARSIWQTGRCTLR